MRNWAHEDAGDQIADQRRNPKMRCADQAENECQHEADDDGGEISGVLRSPCRFLPHGFAMACLVNSESYSRSQAQAVTSSRGGVARTALSHSRSAVSSVAWEREPQPGIPIGDGGRGIFFIIYFLSFSLFLFSLFFPPYHSLLPISTRVVTLQDSVRARLAAFARIFLSIPPPRNDERWG